jgi:hypothetical protein
MKTIFNVGSYPKPTVKMSFTAGSGEDLMVKNCLKQLAFCLSSPLRVFSLGL